MGAFTVDKERQTSVKHMNANTNKAATFSNNVFVVLFKIKCEKMMRLFLSRRKINKTKTFFTGIKNTSCQPTPQSQVAVIMGTHTKLMGVKCWLAWTHVLLADLEKHVVSQYPVFLSRFPPGLLMTHYLHCFSQHNDLMMCWKDSGEGHVT